jgi:quercetin dioxygenase-like cupin family protein
MKLSDLLTYQTGAVVSKALLDAAKGSVTAFAFDEGQGLSEHTAPYDALIIVVEGQADIEISGKGYHLNQGEMIIMPANQPHAVKAVTKFKMILTMIRAG